MTDIVKRLRWLAKEDPWQPRVEVAAQAAAVLALLARAERAEAERDAARSYLATLLLTYHPEVEPLPDLMGVCTQIDNAMVGMWKKRDAARAEAARLRRGWLTTIQTENSCPASGGGCLAKRCACIAEMEMQMRQDDQIAALAAKEPGHE